MKVFLDTNVLLDILQNRMPWAEDAVVIFRAIAGKQIEGCITAKQIADLYFFARKMYRCEENVDAKARQVISKLMGLFRLVDTLAVDCQNALGVNNSDYEDAVLIAAASREKSDCIITRNTNHFMDSPIPVYTPSDFLTNLVTPFSDNPDQL